MRSKLLLCAALAPMLFVNVVQAQESRGTILGRVTDSTGAVVPTAEVKVTNVATGLAVTAKTNESGNYSLPFLVAGFYNVTAESTGFKKFVRENVQVRVNDKVEVNMQMEIGDVSEKVEVTGAPPLLATADASLGQVVDERRVLELPLVQRQRHGVRTDGAGRGQHHRHAPAQGAVQQRAVAVFHRRRRHL